MSYAITAALCGFTMLQIDRQLVPFAMVAGVVAMGIYRQLTARKWPR